MKKHLKRLKTAQRRSATATAVFTRTERKLTSENERIAAVVAEIDNDIIALQNMRQEAVSHHTVNTTILGNIAKILRG